MYGCVWPVVQRALQYMEEGGGQGYNHGDYEKRAKKSAPRELPPSLRQQQGQLQDAADHTEVEMTQVAAPPGKQAAGGAKKSECRWELFSGIGIVIDSTACSFFFGDVHDAHCVTLSVLCTVTACSQGRGCDPG